jgi:hydrogenase maturation factor HypF (carbamoyltransferase family)
MGFSDGVLDWAPMMHDLLHDVEDGVSKAIIAAKFHRALVEGIVNVAVR